MGSSDYIAGLAVLISLIALYKSHRIENKKDKKDKLEFIKLLSSGLRQMKYQDSMDERLFKQGEIIDELNYCSAFCGEEKYEQFKEDLDTKVYMVTNSTNEGDFTRLYNEGLNLIASFSKEHKK